MTQPIGVNFDQAVRDSVMQLLSDPIAFPEVFKSWVTGWIEANPPTLPIGQITGFAQNTVRNFSRSSAAVNVTNTAAETAVASEDIAAKALGTQGALRLTMIGTYANTTGVDHVVTIRVKFGGTTIATLSSTITGAVGSAVFHNESIIGNLTPSSQFGDSWVILDIATHTASGTAAVDTTKQQTLQVTAQWDAASASLSFDRQYYLLELLSS